MDDAPFDALDRGILGVSWAYREAEMSTKPLFDAIRTIKGEPLTQADVDAVNAALPRTAAATSSDIDPKLIAELRRDEGVVPHAYQDHLGYWTIGVGRLIDKRKGGRLTDEEIDYLLANDIRACIADVADLPAWQVVKADPVRARALINMRFQLGGAGLRGFKNSLAMIAAKRWAEAGKNLRQSLWYKQTPARAERVIRMVETGTA